MVHAPVFGAADAQLLVGLQHLAGDRMDDGIPAIQLGRVDGFQALQQGVRALLPCGDGSGPVVRKARMGGRIEPALIGGKRIDLELEGDDLVGQTTDRLVRKGRRCAEAKQGRNQPGSGFHRHLLNNSSLRSSHIA